MRRDAEDEEGLGDGGEFGLDLGVHLGPRGDEREGVGAEGGAGLEEGGGRAVGSDELRVLLRLGETCWVYDLEEVGEGPRGRGCGVIVEIVDEFAADPLGKDKVGEDNSSLGVLLTIGYKVVQGGIQSFALSEGVVDAETTPYIGHGLWLDCERCDDSELAAASPHGLSEIRMSCGVNVDDRAIGHDSLPSNDVVSS